MAVIDLFNSGDKKKRLSHIKNLILIAAADGEIDKNEISLISGIAARVGLSTNELDEILRSPKSISFSPPKEFKEKIEQLYDMVLLMMIDGKIHANEVALCKIFAMKLGFKHDIIEKIVLSIVQMIEKGQTPEKVKADLEKEYA